MLNNANRRSYPASLGFIRQTVFPAFTARKAGNKKPAIPFKGFLKGRYAGFVDNKQGNYRLGKQNQIPKGKKGKNLPGKLLLFRRTRIPGARFSLQIRYEFSQAASF
jgi:hypothetical protein